MHRYTQMETYIISGTGECRLLHSSTCYYIHTYRTLHSELTWHLPLFIPLRLVTWLHDLVPPRCHFFLLAVWQSNISGSCSHFKAFMLMLWLLAVLSQRDMSLQFRQLAGSPGHCVAGPPHPWLILLLSAQQGYVIPAGMHGERLRLPGCITALLLLLGWWQFMLFTFSLPPPSLSLALSLTTYFSTKEYNRVI